MELVASGLPLRDAEHRRGEDRKQQRGVEVRESQNQAFFPIAM
jgi:hypothetical protein